jgi:tetratricopeptide (TPR) repeat protein
LACSRVDSQLKIRELGDLYVANGDYLQAEQMLQKALGIFERTGETDTINVASLLRQLGEIYMPGTIIRRGKVMSGDPSRFWKSFSGRTTTIWSTPSQCLVISPMTRSNAKSRAQVLRAVAEDVDLNSSEFNRAFVLMQFFGYLRRNPNDTQDIDYTGFDFWLRKFDQFNRNFQNAEMVKVFISSIEYRQRWAVNEIWSWLRERKRHSRRGTPTVPVPNCRKRELIHARGYCLLNTRVESVAPRGLSA